MGVYLLMKTDSQRFKYLARSDTDSISFYKLKVKYFDPNTEKIDKAKVKSDLTRN